MYILKLFFQHKHFNNGKPTRLNFELGTSDI